MNPNPAVPDTTSSSSSRRVEKLQQKRVQLKQASDLIRFNYSRSAVTVHHDQGGGPTARRHHRSRGLSISKSQYVQANFKFILSPLMSPLEPCLHDADDTVPWSQVVCVIVPPHDSSDHEMMCFDDDDEDDAESFCLECPICLDEAQIPRITSCGHVFCCTCILRHLGTGSRGANKCPICTEFLCASDLKSVTSSPNTSSRSTRDKLEVNCPLEFALLEVTKGSVTPRLLMSTRSQAVDGPTQRSPTSDKLALNSVIPNMADAHAPYSRLASITVDMRLELFVKDRDALLQFRQLCLQSSCAGTTTTTAAASRFGDVEALPYIEQALDLLQLAEADFQRRLGLGLGSGLGLGLGLVDGAAYRAADGEGWRAAENKCVSVSGSSSPLPSVSGQLTMDRDRDRDRDRADKSGGAEDRPDVSPVKQSDAKRCTLNHSSNPSVAGERYPIYQLYTGELVFLHPICTRCLVESAVAAAAADREGGGGDVVLSSLLPALLSGTIIDIESVRVTASSRQRYNVLRHLPLHCEATLIEIDLMALVPALVSEQVLSNFKDQLAKRAQARKEKRRLMLRESQMESDRRAAEEMLRRDQVLHAQALQRAEATALQELQHGPALGSSLLEEEEGSNTPAVDAPPSLPPQTDIVPAHRSFARITKMGMGRDFPSLADSFQIQARGTVSRVLKAAPNPSVRHPSSSASAWGKGSIKAVDAVDSEAAVAAAAVCKEGGASSQADPMSAAIAQPGPQGNAVNPSPNPAAASSAKKKGKTKIVLMSNSSFRGACR